MITMMSLKEYAVDVDKSIEEIMSLCKKLDIKIRNEDDMLSEDDIILLDNELSSEETKEEKEEIIEEEDEVLDDDALEKDLRIEAVQDKTTKKMKKQNILRQHTHTRTGKSKRTARPNETKR